MLRRAPSVLVAGLSLFGLAAAVAVSERGARAQEENPDALLRADRAAAIKRVAAQMFAESRYRDALAQFQAAYAVRQEAALLLHIARTYQRLGDLREARAFYVRYLTAAPAGPSELRSEAEQAIARLDQLSSAPLPGLSQPFVALETPTVRVVKSPYHAVTRNAGIALFAVVHAASAVTGMVCVSVLGFNGLCTPMFVPGIGPVISAGVAGSAPVSVPVALISGGLQLAGIGLWAGAYRHPEMHVVSHEPQAQLAPKGGTETGGLAVGVRF